MVPLDSTPVIDPSPLFPIFSAIVIRDFWVKNLYPPPN
jgi:hypothetical protein